MNKAGYFEAVKAADEKMVKAIREHETEEQLNAAFVEHAQDCQRAYDQFLANKVPA